MLKETLNGLNLPRFPFGMPIEEAKNTMLGVLLEEEYGVLPNRETSLSWETVSEEENFAAHVKDVNELFAEEQHKNAHYHAR